jgi:hypothetical protein
LWQEFFFQYFADVFPGLVERVDSLCMDDAVIGLVFSDAPIGLCGSAVCYQFHGSL